MNLHNAYALFLIIFGIPIFSSENPKENPQMTLFKFNLEIGYAHLAKEAPTKTIPITSPHPHKATALLFYMNRVPTSNNKK